MDPLEDRLAPPHEDHHLEAPLVVLRRVHLLVVHQLGLLELALLLEPRLVCHLEIRGLVPQVHVARRGVLPHVGDHLEALLEQLHEALHPEDRLHEAAQPPLLRPHELLLHPLEPHSKPLHLPALHHRPSLVVCP